MMQEHSLALGAGDFAGRGSPAPSEMQWGRRGLPCSSSVSTWAGLLLPLTSSRVLRWQCCLLVRTNCLGKCRDENSERPPQVES